MHSNQWTWGFISDNIHRSETCIQWVTFAFCCVALSLITHTGETMSRYEANASEYRFYALSFLGKVQFSSAWASGPFLLANTFVEVSINIYCCSHTYMQIKKKLNKCSPTIVGLVPRLCFQRNSFFINCTIIRVMSLGLHWTLQHWKAFTRELEFFPILIANWC